MNLLLACACGALSTPQWAWTAAAKRSGISGGEIVPPADGGAAVAFDGGLDHGDGGEAGHRRFVGIAAVGGEPADGVADSVPAHLDAAVVGGGFAAKDALDPKDRRRSSPPRRRAGRLSFSWSELPRSVLPSMAITGCSPAAGLDALWKSGYAR